MDEQETKMTKAKKIDKKAEEIAQLTDRLLRLQAEFENYKKRSRAELEDRTRYGIQEIMQPLLLVVDNFERALSHPPDEESIDSYTAGIEMIYKQFMETLGAQGLERMEPIGQPFDPIFHEGVMNEVVDEEGLAGCVTGELQSGYTLNNKVIRPAMVKIGIKG